MDDAAECPRWMAAALCVCVRFRVVPDSDERAIFIRGPVVVFKWRNEPGWPVDYASPNVREVFGYSAEEFVRGDVSYASLVPPEDLERVAQEVSSNSESGASSFVHEPYRVRHRSGEIRWLYDFTHVVRDREGQTTHYYGYVVDITERIRAEEEARELDRRLLHAQKLESLGLLAGGVAHDFNNLLAGILGQVGLARRRLHDKPAQADEALAQIEQLVRRAADFTKQLLTYAGRGQAQITEVDLGQLVEELRGMVEVMLPSGDALVFERHEQLPMVRGDRSQLQQVVMNLLTNAAEALGESGVKVVVRVAELDLGEDELRERYGRTDLAHGRYVELEVRDDGVGMDDAVLARLFDPFYTTKANGRGLGMSAVQGIVRSHDGHIHVESRPGEGTTFRVLLPVASASV
jgi:two-component system, cell cycle sensor histidine kinase and response regulator CckA